MIPNILQHDTNFAMLVAVVTLCLLLSGATAHTTLYARQLHAENSAFDEPISRGFEIRGTQSPFSFIVSVQLFIMMIFTTSHHCFLTSENADSRTG